MKRLATLLLGLLTVTMCAAKPISEKEAWRKAQEFLQKNIATRAGNMVVKEQPTELSQKNIFVFNAEANAGFVVVSADDRTEAILGYSDKGNIDPNNIPSNVKWLLDSYDIAIAWLDNGFKWKTQTRASNVAIAPLVETQWNQGSPYNNLCPTIGDDKCLTGCVATAMAQIINFHKWPQDVTSSVPQYISSSSQLNMPELPPTTFDWKMDDYNIAKLMLYCGQSVKMDYGINASGAIANFAADAMVNVFGFSKGTSYVLRSNFDDTEWNELVYKELSEKRPLFYNGFSPEAGGHAFVVDGYEDGLYHLNWGWGGYLDGYFALENLQPQKESGFNNDQGMIINACPPGGSDEFPQPTVAAVGFICVERNFTKEKAEDDFKNITISCEFENDLASNSTIEIGFGLFDGENLIKSLAEEMHTFSAKGKYIYEAKLTFTSDLPYGQFNIRAITRTDVTKRWLSALKSETVYVQTLLQANYLHLQPYPKVGDDRWKEEYGIHTINGITYYLYNNDKNYYATVYPPDETKPYSGNIYVPDSIDFHSIIFKVREVAYNAFRNCNEITEISSSAYYYGCAWYLSKLKKLELREGVNSVYNVAGNPELETLTFPSSCKSIVIPQSCKKLKTITFKNVNDLRLVINQMDADSWNANNMPALRDIYFEGEVPPVLFVNNENQNGRLEANPIVVVHVPKGTKEIYENAGWGNWNVVDDLTGNLPSIPYDYYGDYNICYWFTIDLPKDCVEVAMRIPAEDLLPYKGQQISAIEVYNYQTEYVFIAGNDDSHIVKQAIKGNEGNTVRVILDEPYTITGEELYIGVGNKGIINYFWTTEEKNDNGMWARVFGDDTSLIPAGKWVMGAGQKNWNRSLPIRAIIQGENLPLDVKISATEFVSSSTSDKKQALIHLNNRTPRTIIKEVKLDWSVDDVVQTPLTFSTSINPNKEEIVVVDFPTENMNRRFHSIQFNVVSINGKPDEIPSNSNVNIEYETISKFFPRKIVMEEATGTWCGWCARGYETMELNKKKYPDNFLGIAFHNGDEMTVESGADPFFDIISGYPNIFINRTKEIGGGPLNLDDQKESGIAELSLKAQLSPSNLKKISVNVEAFFGFDDNKAAANYRFAFAVVEDNVGPYNQNNYYSDPDAPSNPNDYMDWWVHQEFKVSKVFHDVARGIYPDYNGINGLLPKEIKMNEKYNVEYTIPLPSTILDLKNVRVVALLIDNKAGEILNANDTKLNIDVKAFDKGDVNGDGNINVSDISLTIAKIMGILDKENTFYFDLADINQDGKIVVNDLTALIDIVLHKGKTKAISRAINTLTDVISASEVRKLDNGAAEMDVAIAGNCFATQFDISLPEGVEIDNIALIGNESQSHSLVYDRLSADQTRVVVYSMGNKEFGESSIRISFYCRNSKDAELLLSNVIVNRHENNGKIVEYAATDVSKTITKGATSINNIVEGMKVSVNGKNISIVSDANRTVSLTNSSGITQTYDIKAGVNTIDVPIEGVYLLENKKIIIR